MNQSTMAPLMYDPTGVMIAETGLAPDELTWLAPRLEAARNETLDDLELWKSGREVPRRKTPLDAGFVDLPERILEAYAAEGAKSELGQILATAKRLGAIADRVVILGIGGSYMGARALFEACCHPYHNERSRQARGGCPRIYFQGNNVDNDASQALLDVLRDEADDRWAIIVISKSGGTLETAVAFRIFLDALREACGDDMTKVCERVVPVTGTEGRLRNLAAALGCPEVFSIPEGVGGRFSIFSPVGLLPAAVMGLDVVRLLEGAAMTNERFCNSPVGRNPVLDYVGVCRMMEVRRGAAVRVLSTWGQGLEAVGLWYDQLLSESLGKDGQGATPLTVVNTRDLHSRGQQHQEGRRDKLITNVIVEEPRREVLAIREESMNQDRLNELAGKTVPDILRAALAGTNQAYADDRRPTADLRLPRLDESSLGQLFQMFMLATAVEGRLMGINPYGQPGVEAYKKNMNALLRG